MSSKQSRSKPARTRKRAAEPTLAEFRAFTVGLVAGFATVEAIIRVEGRVTVVLAPLGGGEPPEGFDLAVTALGINRFVRARTGADWPEGAISEAVRHTLVTGIAPGFRHRRPLRVVFDDELN